MAQTIVKKGVEAKISRCGWCVSDPLMTEYHDREWGVPVYDDLKIFEFLTLESAQAGLSWRTVLYKRENYRKAFADFNPKKVAAFDQAKVEKLLQNPGIIRNRLKVQATINNAQRFLEVQKKFGQFSKYIWEFVDGSPVKNRWKTLSQVPPVTQKAELLSKDLKAKGFKFLGPTVVYAHMQAAGMVNDHLVGCFRHKEI